MKIVIVYSSVTGNTKMLAEAVKEELACENIIYFGVPQDDVYDADLYIIGSWTDKGNASEDILDFIKRLKNKRAAFFGTAGYGGSSEYYQSLFERVKSCADISNKMEDYFYCQGKMPLMLRERYVTMLTQHPEDKKLKAGVENFDEALSHPDENDIQNIRRWAKNLVDKYSYNDRINR